MTGRFGVGIKAGQASAVVGVEYIAHDSWVSPRQAEMHVVHAWSGPPAIEAVREEVVALQRGPLAAARWRVDAAGLGMGLREDLSAVHRGNDLGIQLLPTAVGLWRVTALVQQRMVATLLAAKAGGRLLLADDLEPEARARLARELANLRLSKTARGRQRVEADQPEDFDEMAGALMLAAMGGRGTPRFRDPSGRLWDSYVAAEVHLGGRLDAMQMGTRVGQSYWPSE